MTIARWIFWLASIALIAVSLFFWKGIQILMGGTEDFGPDALVVLGPALEVIGGVALLLVVSKADPKTDKKEAKKIAQSNVPTMPEYEPPKEEEEDNYLEYYRIEKRAHKRRVYNLTIHLLELLEQRLANRERIVAGLLIVIGFFVDLSASIFTADIPVYYGFIALAVFVGIALPVAYHFAHARKKIWKKIEKRYPETKDIWEIPGT